MNACTDIPWPPTERPSRRAVAGNRAVTGAFFALLAGLALMLPGRRLEPGLLVVWSVVGGYVVLPPFVALHELSHAAGMLLAGGRPRFGTMRWFGRRHYYVCAPGARFSRVGWSAVIAAPTIVVNAVGLALLVGVPLLRGPMVVALTLHLRGCFFDFRMLRLTARLPHGAVVEDMAGGIRVWHA